MVRRWQAGQGLREAARDTRLGRKTVRRYFTALKGVGAARDVEIDDVLFHAVASLVQTRAMPDPSMERAALMEHRDRTEPWLTQKKPLRLTKVHALLERDHGVKASYATLRRFAIEELGWRRRKPTVRLAAHRLHERQPPLPEHVPDGRRLGLRLRDLFASLRLPG